MTLKTKSIIILAVLCCAFSSITAQDYTVRQRTLRVAVLAPLYIDSAFNGYAYKLPPATMPKYMLPGLDFYNGVMMAVDSLNKEHAQLEVWIYDTKKAGQSMAALMKSMEYMNFSLIIASFNNTAEQKAVSEFSFSKNIPVISATYPNDAGIVSNPFFVLINSSLKTHVEAVYKYIQQNYPIGRLVYVTRKGTLESKILSYFAAMDAQPNKLRYKVVELADNFSSGDVIANLDSTRQNIVVCGTVNEAFGTQLVRALGNAPGYRNVAVGMPTWDVINPSSVKNVEVVYSTPYNFSRTDKLGKFILKKYQTKFQGRASDMVFKGFESMYHFSKLLMEDKNDFINSLSDTTFKVANDFHIEPVRLTSTSFVPDYLENKKLYFIKMQEGAIKSVN